MASLTHLHFSKAFYKQTHDPHLNKERSRMNGSVVAKSQRWLTDSIQRMLTNESRLT